MNLDYLEVGARIVTTTFYQVILLFLPYFDFYQTNSVFNFSYQKEKKCDCILYLWPILCSLLVSFLFSWFFMCGCEYGFECIT